VPMPLGLKLAGYAAALGRARDRLARLRREALALEFGGAGGTLAALGERGLDIRARLAALLDLPLPEAPWHGHRDRIAEIATGLALLAGTCGKIGRDIVLMTQSEVGEAFERPRTEESPSTTLPQARLAVAASAALAGAAAAPALAATLLAAQVQDHEGTPGGWQTEWAAVPALALHVSAALAGVVALAEGLEIDAERMRANIENAGGQIMGEAVSFALSEALGRPEAHALMRMLSRRARDEGRPLKEVLLADPRVTATLTPVEIEKLLVPLTYQGAAQVFIDRLVVASQTRGPRRQEARNETRHETRHALHQAREPAPAHQDGSDRDPAPEPPGAAEAQPQDAAERRYQSLGDETSFSTLETAPQTPAENPNGATPDTADEEPSKDAAEPAHLPAAPQLTSLSHGDATGAAAEVPRDLPPPEIIPPEPVAGSAAPPDGWEDAAAPRAEPRETPGALMDVFVRAQAEAATLDDEAGKRS